MKIAVLQFAPQVEMVEANVHKADIILSEKENFGVLEGLDLLVLPELAFAGYNHPSLAAITPYLEPTACGLATEWAKTVATRLKCTVAIGYAEVASDSNSNDIPGLTSQAETEITAYNSLVFVDSSGEVVAHYRKSFLYYTDETWAKEGSGFYSGTLPLGSKRRPVDSVAGICMDINPYKFQTPWTTYEFGNHARSSKADLVVLSMAWLTRLTHLEVMGKPHTPDLATVNYWLDRLRPLFGSEARDEEVIVVFGNRTGEEGTAPLIGEVRYAGSSCVFGLKKDGSIRIWNMLGRGEEKLLVVDTDSSPIYEMVESSTSTPSTNGDLGSDDDDDDDIDGEDESHSKIGVDT